MYYVYRLSINEHEYIGCTNNIRRRQNQHNENARKRKSKLGRYLNDNGIVLTNDDFQILATFADRPDALKHERATAMEMESKGATLLNDNFSKYCTRKGKNLGNTAKDFVVVDYINHTITPVHDLRQYCIANGWDNRLVHRTVGGDRYCMYGCKAFYADAWENEPNKERYISGAFVEEAEQNARAIRAAKTSKVYEIRFPDNHTEIVKNVDKFAREHNLSGGTLHATLTNGKSTKGYQVLRRI